MIAGLRYPPTAMPLLTMATSAMDLNQEAAAPYDESTADAWLPGLRLLLLIPFFGGAKMAPIIKVRDGRITGLGWPPLDEYILNNQPNGNPTTTTTTAAAAAGG